MAFYVQQMDTCPSLNQKIIDNFLLNFLKYYKKKKIGDIITCEQFVFICHKVIDAFLEDDSLVCVHDEEGVAVIGDIHGSFPDLIKVLDSTGWPTERTLVFLGDYVDRGSNSIEVLILLFLLKIRYTKRVFLLRGNHETYEENSLYNLPEKMSAIYPDSSPFLHYLLNYTFDHMPVAAILSDQIYCCHGGIPRFLCKRESIKEIPRPTSWLNLKTDLGHSILLTDTLWADPADTPQREQFLPSPRGASYVFNLKAVREQLKVWKCRALLRAHCPYEIGLSSFLNGYCYTIHSSKDKTMESYLASVLLIEFNPITNLLEADAIYFHAGETDVRQIVHDFYVKFNSERTLFPMDKPLPIECVQCGIWKAGMLSDKLLWDRCLSHTQLCEIIEEYADSSKTARSYLRKIRKSKDKDLMAAKLFPSFYSDMLNKGYMLVIKNEEMERNDISEGPNISTQTFKIDLPLDDSKWPKLEIRGMRRYKTEIGLFTGT